MIQPHVPQPTTVRTVIEEATATLPRLSAGTNELRAAAHLIDSGVADSITVQDAETAVNELLMMSEQLSLSLRQARARLHSYRHRMTETNARRLRGGMLVATT